MPLRTPATSRQVSSVLRPGRGTGPPGAGAMGFTLLELTLTIVILAVLGTVATVRFLDLRNEARESAEQGVVAAVRQGISAYAAESALRDRTPAFPPELDPAAAGGEGTEDALFGRVLKDGISGKGWVKTAEQAYRAPSGATYLYDPTAGRFAVSLGAPPEEGGALTSLGSTFEEITGGMIERIQKYYEENGSFPRSWGDFVFTDIGLDPDEWQGKAFEGLIYSPVGNRVSVKPAAGQMITVLGKDGTPRKLLPSYHWYLVHDMKTGTWYYHSIAEENEIDIHSMEVHPIEDG